MWQQNLVFSDPVPDQIKPPFLRRPLSDSAGNIKYPIPVPNGSCNDQKGVEPAPNPQFMLPSQSSGSIRQKANGRRKKRNPISQSVQYRAYRSRQTREGCDQKWPDKLEDLFLDAIELIPHMGRRKYSLKGKPHGRNELISEYLWIGYINSLPPGAPRDRKMKRTRKQISSHIQVLKGFMKEHSAYSRLFPDNTAVANDSEQSFKDNKTLIALNHGQLPMGHYDEDNSNENPQHLFKPSSFEMFVSTSENEFYESVRIHSYSSLSSLPFNESSESIDMVRDKFPELKQLESTNSLPQCVIHLSVGISLMKERPNGAELNVKMFLRVNSHLQTKWQTSTTLVKPKDLSGPRDLDPPIYKKIDPVEYIPEEDGTSKLHISFPALPWAHAFIKLIDLLDDTLLETITMYQEISSKTGSQPYIRRAVLLWTFHKSQDVGTGETTWQYIRPSKQNHIFSPVIDEPQPQHPIYSATYEGPSTSWEDRPLYSPSALMDSFTQPFDSHRQISASILCSPFNPGSQYTYDTPNGNHHLQKPLPSTPQAQTCPSSSQNCVNSYSHDRNSNIGIHDTTVSTINFDSNLGLDIQSSYSGVEVGWDAVDFNTEDIEGEGNALLISVPGVHHYSHFDDQLNVDVDFDDGGGEWGYERMGKSVEICGVRVSQWDDGVGMAGLGGDGDGIGHWEGGQGFGGNVFVGMD